MLPDGIPTVTVTGRYLSLNDGGQPLSGQVIFRAPSLITFPDYDVILGGPVAAPLDATGAFRVELPATDAPGMNPTGWSYQVAEQLAGVPMNRVYNVLLSAETPAVDIADIAPTDPTTPNYVAVRGDSAYEVAVKNGFVGTVEQWLASLVGPQGVKGDTGAQGPEGDDAYEVAVAAGYVGTREQWLASLVGPQGAKGDTGDQGPAGAPGVVQSVNGISAAEITLDAAAVHAVPDTAPGAPNGVAQLDETGKVPAAQLPASSGGGAVETVNGKSPDTNGNVALVAADVGALATTVRGAANGVASLGSTSKVPDAQLPYDGWRPADLGMKAWAFDPAVGQSGGRTPSNGSFRIIAVPVRESITVSSLVFHVFGYEGTGLDTGSRAGIFNASGTRLAQTADMADTAVMIDIHNAGGQTVTCALTAPITLQPGIYYVCFRWVIGTTANAPVLMTADSTSACPVVTLTSVKPFGVISGMTSWPTSFAPSAIETDPIKFWAALA